MYVNIKTQKDGLNMNPACSASLGMYEWRRHGFVYYTNTEAHMNSWWFSASASHYMNTWTYRLCFSNFIYIYIYAFSRRFYPKRLTLHSVLYIFCQYVCSLGIEPTTFCAANAMLYHWATGTHLRKLASYHTVYTETSRQPVKIKVRFNM